MVYLNIFYTINKIESITTTTFAASAGLVDIIKKLVLSKFMGLVSSVSVIFYTEAINSCSSKK